MIPVLFDGKTTDFTTNGKGRLADAVRCEVHQVLNGLYELEMEYPVTGSHFADLENGAVIGVKAEDAEKPRQGFRIYCITKPGLTGTCTVKARHVSYQANWIPVAPGSASSLADAFAKLKSLSLEDNPFTLWTDKTTVTGMSWLVPTPFRSLLGGVRGSVLDTYGGEYEWDNYTIKLWKHRGADNGVSLRYGKNIVDINQEANIENTYTGIMPYWNGEGGVVTLDSPVESSQAAAFPFRRTMTMDFTEAFEKKPTAAQLRQYTLSYINRNQIGHPNVSVNVDFVALWQTEEYKDLAEIQRVSLGDTITVVFPKLDISEKARVIEYTYDVLKERYTDIQIGSLRSTLSKTIADNASGITEIKAETQAKINQSTDWLTNAKGFVVAVKNDDGSWKALEFLNAATLQAATRDLLINNNGIGFGKGVAGTHGTNAWKYFQSWTLDGVLRVGGTSDVAILALDQQGRTIARIDYNGITLTDHDEGTTTDLWNGVLTYNSDDQSGALLPDALELINGNVITRLESGSWTMTNGRTEVASVDDAGRADFKSLYVNGNEITGGTSGFTGTIDYVWDTDGADASPLYGHIYVSNGLITGYEEDD